MPGALEARDEILAGLDSGTLTVPAALDALFAAQITLRNHRRLDVPGSFLLSFRLVSERRNARSSICYA